jgi:glutamyl-Q tRNA(Asp) synthetase
MAGAYVGRFAPSPTGPLHAGSLVAALASWLDARGHGGRWLVRIEDVDTTRCRPEHERHILQQLAACGLVSDAPVRRQSERGATYQQALDTLVANGLAYPCACTRKELAAALLAQGQHKARHGELIYPGTCRHGLHSRAARAWRFYVGFFEEKQAIAPVLIAQAAIKLEDPAALLSAPQHVHWRDRRLGPQQQDVAAEVGDFVLLRADGCWAYQLAVVVDDAAQGITHVVRGQDLADNTPRQILLQRALGLPTPSYLHTPLVCNAAGDKLSKQTGAPALDTSSPAMSLRALQHAATVLALPKPSWNGATALSISEQLQVWVEAWRARWGTGHAQSPCTHPTP